MIFGLPDSVFWYVCVGEFIAVFVYVVYVRREDKKNAVVK